MRRVSIGLIIFGIVLIIAGNFFYKYTENSADSKPMTVNLNGKKSFQWPVYTGVILVFLGITFNIASRKNSKADHSNV
jgi:uncharacterized membrane protein